MVLTVMAVASLPGCGGDSSGSEATGAAVTRGAAPSATSSGEPTSGSSGPAVSPTDPSGDSTTSTPAVEAKLSDTGLGDLRLNMPLKRARALGWVGKPANISGRRYCDMYHGKRGVQYLYFTKDRLVIIAAGPKIKLDTDLGVGSTYEELHSAYGSRLSSEDGELGGGRVYIEAPGAPFHAKYRIGLNTAASYRDSKVTEIALQGVELGCYE